ncbi:MAG: ribose 5-phosphate isomerase B [Holosporaceae bacterium]|jgi:ribose 5-phosphate isomerase B|nr:ribose 5-phosphate isomerase B [Holosporaceae bacterium]
MNIYIASDHAGFLLKQRLIERLDAPLVDLGTDSPEICDYPIFARKLVEKVLEATGNRGILVCGSGIGMSIVANRRRHIRAALCFDESMAQMSRRHNDANVLVLGERITDGQAALNCVRMFLDTEFEGGRHKRRLDMIDAGDDG